MSLGSIIVIVNCGLSRLKLDKPVDIVGIVFHTQLGAEDWGKTLAQTLG
jgi:hypothetical protein